MPLVFSPGDTCQFDWRHETVVIWGVEQVVKVANFRLSYSRRMFVVAYPRETQEMVMDAHIQAFAFFGGVPKRMVYDNLKTVVDRRYRLEALKRALPAYPASRGVPGIKKPT